MEYKTIVGQINKEILNWLVKASTVQKAISINRQDLCLKYINAHDKKCKNQRNPNT
jgi:hypothetical protein